MAPGTVTNANESVRTQWSHSGNVALLWGARDKLNHLCKTVPDEDLSAKDIIALIQKAAIAYAVLFYKYKEGEFPLAIWANLIRPRLLLLHGTDTGLFRRSEDDIIEKLGPPVEISDGMSFDETILEARACSGRCDDVFVCWRKQMIPTYRARTVASMVALHHH